MFRQLEIMPYIEYVRLVMNTLQREKTGLPNPHLASLNWGIRLRCTIVSTVPASASPEALPA